MARLIYPSADFATNTKLARAFSRNAECGMFDWNDLKYFLAVARAGTTLKAAATLKVSQSTAARRIAALEKAIGVKLFDKRQSGYVPTEAGSALIKTAEEVETSTGVFGAAASAHKRGLTGTVQFTCSEIAVSALFMSALREFRDAYPSVRLELITTDRRLDLAAGEADVAFRRVRRPPSQSWSDGGSRSTHGASTARSPMRRSTVLRRHPRICRTTRFSLFTTNFRACPSSNGSRGMCRKARS